MIKLTFPILRRGDKEKDIRIQNRNWCDEEKLKEMVDLRVTLCD